MTQCHGTKALKHGSIDCLKVLYCRNNFACALGHFIGDLVREFSSRRVDRGGADLQSEKTWPNLIVKLERRAAPLVILCPDQLPVECNIFGTHGLESICERIELVDNDRQLAGIGLRQSDCIALMLQI